ncbi:DUF1353 domain-containing protein [Sphingomonas oligophenolica]|uniref:DUF1353 domain-containing protein n=1 Tax=Sphingomonas oligophenolica TaxID=301154 RepID=A0A502CPB5_9SPHN|nr:DUF1353 domain-containing protein [Sphingomonas oligophenolica]TPG14370.1 DUF1353 domain-containing protein [Sphingomonas oligophenolica]
MSGFTRALLEPTGQTREGRAIYRVAESFAFEIGYKGSGLAITVPAGFETDGPSVPWWALKLIDVGAMIRSAAVHDRLREDLRFSKLEGDAIFLTAMAAEDVTPWQRELVFEAVRLNETRARAT